MGKTQTKGQNPIDRLMERASAALVATKYFEATRLASTALSRAHAASDFERMARITLPLQEARRQIREQAVDTGFSFILAKLSQIPETPEPGCYLFQPPLIGADAKAFREASLAQGIPVLVITREPLTREGKWPVVSVGTVSVRTRIDPPVPLERIETTVCKDSYGPGSEPPSARWFVAAEEALGDSAIARLKPEDPAAWRVDDLMEFLDAHPDHEKLHQRLAENCRQAMKEDLPEGRRHRPTVDDPYSF